MIRQTPFLNLLSMFDAVSPTTVLPVQVTRSRTTSPGISSNARSGMPIDCYATNDHAVVLASLPGVHPDDVSVTVNEDTLIISGSVMSDRKQQDAQGDPVTWYMSEIPRGMYERRIRLPFPIQEEGVEAQFSNGMLRIVLPKLEAAKPHRVTVQVLESRFPEISADSTEEDESFSAD